MGDYLPGKESDLKVWAVNFAARITAAPADYGKATRCKATR